ncbi:MAG: thioredoxin [Acidobacteriota bacterium]|nr:thioredoxin [Acidobacteriota bacterium]
MSAELEEIKDAEFEEKVLGREGVTIVDFWASWCGPCRMLAPTLKDIQSELGDKIKIVKMNTDTELQTAAQHGVQSLPTLLMFKNGEKVANMIGNAPKSKLMTWIEPHL